MGLTDIFYRFGVSLIIGFLIGIQREYANVREENRTDLDHTLFAGARTFSLLGLYGCAAAYMGEAAGAFWVTVALILPAGMLIVAAYAIDAWRGQIGMTTEVAGLMTILIGVMCYGDHLALAAALGVVTMTLLTLKLQIHTFARELSREDIYATIKFATITALILPVLPHTGYGPSPFDVLVPYNVWLMVVFISGISFFGYVVMKFVGPERGVGLTGILGGLVSSTAVTLSLSQRSRDAQDLSRAFALGIMAAWAIMYLRVMVIVAVLNLQVFQVAWKALLAAFFVAGLYCIYLYMRHQRRQQEGSREFKNPFELGPAITFGLLYAVILLVAHAAQLYFGNAGVYVSSVATGLVDVDAITISVSKLSGPGSDLIPAVAARAVVFAAASNTFVKGCIVFFTASPQTRKLVLPGMVFILGTAIATVLLI
ncbi:MAG TPA: MgtC/SapB family protein [Deltaproteobacteria bacterium]|nr:MgtC/SapB family protein [Deltaproteobacteria bacterium]